MRAIDYLREKKIDNRFLKIDERSDVAASEGYSILLDDLLSNYAEQENKALHRQIKEVEKIINEKKWTAVAMVSSIKKALKK